MKVLEINRKSIKIYKNIYIHKYICKEISVPLTHTNLTKNSLFFANIWLTVRGSGFYAKRHFGN